MTQKRIRELQPPPPAENITLEEARRIWREIKAGEEEAKRQQEAANRAGAPPAGRSAP